jgi:hypothetical protein
MKESFSASGYTAMTQIDTTPRSTRTSSNDSSDYAPYALLAIVALGVAALYLLLLFVFGFGALRQGQSFILPELLAIPLLALVLSFAARRQIVNSEGTRIGLKFCDWAWWIAVVGGFGYLAYLGGTYFAIRKDADRAFRNWADRVAKANPLDPKNVDFAAAFHATLPPDKQPSVAMTDVGKMQGLAMQGWIAFKQSDLIRLSLRNRDELRFEPGGLEEWTQKGPKLECKLTVKSICPEGEFTSSVGMLRLSEPGKDPVWQVQPPGDDNTLFLRTARLNDYGERIRDMDLAGKAFVYQHLLGNAALRNFNAKLLDEFRRGGINGDEVVARLKAEARIRMMGLGGMGWFLPEPKDFAELAKTHFQPVDKGDPAREAEQRQLFAGVWKSGLIGGPGMTISKSPDLNAVLLKLAKGWELRVPIELQMSMASTGTAARGVCVLICDDAAFLAELDAFKAKPGPMHDARPLMAPSKPVPWRFDRFESDMKMITAPRMPGNPNDAP